VNYQYYKTHSNITYTKQYAHILCTNTINPKFVFGRFYIQTPLVMPRSASELIQQMNLSAAKATNAITNLGVTITMGFLSTFLAGIILLSGRLYFFQQFGIFMACLMAFSFVYAFSMLMPLLATFGKSHFKSYFSSFFSFSFFLIIYKFIYSS
jgi:hypothetical protein